MEIIEPEAEIIRRIFGEYAEGVSPRSIAAGLNRDGVSPPRGTRWNASTINGNCKRGNGILLNPIYSGQIVWNRLRMVKDPDTGKRVSRINPELEWQTVAAPQLRIVEQGLFDAAGHRKAEAGSEQAKHAPRAKRLLSGLLRCGACGGGMTIIGRDRSGPRIQCSTHKESGSCSNGARYYISKVEHLVISALRLALADSDLVGAYVEAYREERHRIESAARRERATTERSLAVAKASIERLVRALVDGVLTHDEVATQMKALRAEHDRLASHLAAAEQETAVRDVRPQAVERFRQNMEALTAILAESEGVPPENLARPFRSLVESVTISPRRAREQYEVKIDGYLTSLLGADLSSIAMVAEEGFEPPTQGL